MPKTIYLLSGIPGSGKSTWAKNCVEFNKNSIYISRDEIRFSLLKENEDYFKHEKRVFKLFIEAINNALNENFEDIYVDATHINNASRNKVLRKLKGDFKLIHVIFKTDLVTCLKRNEKRVERERVPEEVIRRFYTQFEMPKDGIINIVENDVLVFSINTGKEKDNGYLFNC